MTVRHLILEGGHKTGTVIHLTGGRQDSGTVRRLVVEEDIAKTLGQ